MEQERRGKGIKKNLLKEIDNVQMKISQNPLDDSFISKLDQLNNQLDKILDNETKGLIIRSRSRWIEEGEKSTKYFCNLEKRSAEKKSIYRIKDNNDEIISDHTAVLEEIHQFYQNLYEKQNTQQDNIMNFLDDIELTNMYM